MRLDHSPTLDDFRSDVRRFIADNSPGVKAKAGVRAPEPELMPAIRRWTAALYEAGYLGIGWPAEYGGRPDADPREPFIVAEEIARARTWEPVGAAPLAAAAIIDFGTDAQRAHFLPRIRSAEDIWCQLFSEPGAGSDLAALSTRASRDGDVYVVDGQKVWTTNGQHADVGYLLARTDPDAPKHRGISAFALDMTLPGVDIRPLREITGTEDFNEVFLTGVRVPVDAMIGAEGGGWRVAMSSLGHERAGVAAHGVELWRVLDDLAGLVRGRGADDDPGIRRDLGRLAARVQANDALCAATQSRMVSGAEDPLDAPGGKIFFSELNLDMTRFGMGLQGAAAGLSGEDPDAVADGWWQDAFLYARAYTIAGGANEVLRNVIAERTLKMPKDPAA